MSLFENGFLAEYSEQEVPDYRGNPLIESLPPILEMDEAIEALSYYPQYNESERQLGPLARIHCLRRLKKFFLPLIEHIQLEQNIGISIREGYVARNPIKKKEYAIRLQKGYKAIKERKEISETFGDLPTSSAGFTLVGYSGIGKTTALNKVTSLYPKVILHSEYRGEPLIQKQIPFLKLECPDSLKALCLNFFNAVDSILGENYERKFGSQRATAESMRIHMVQVANLHSLGVLIIDEVQHLCKTRSGGDILNFLVTLVNMIGIPVILVGTPKALDILQRQFRQARRGSGQGDALWGRMMKDSVWDFLLETMWEYQWTRTKVKLTKELNDVLYDESQGIMDIAVKLYILAQAEVINHYSEEETITPDLIMKVAKEKLRLVQPMLNAIRAYSKNKQEKVIFRFEDLLPFEDVSVEIDELLDRKETMLRNEDLIARKTKSKKTNKLEQLIASLINFGIDSDVAQEYATRAIAEHGEEREVIALARMALTYIE
ncbi:ATP-binding protein [Paenibacillus sp. GCM10023248]|uniref:ATP-binding protein n=1 Tax=unclassified Paenibacillus TaxID=185978 RepID=UPI002379E2A7|nr:ATP-binding protein [Paenibacillus sp. MAHUQ-63]MDD9267873.1 ATP-binding protein [Paenibacillus sp. MAHUQ-63]